MHLRMLGRNDEQGKTAMRASMLFLRMWQGKRSSSEPHRARRCRRVAGLAAGGVHAGFRADAGEGRREGRARRRTPTRANLLRGEYGPYRANNDLLYYHLDVRVDPVKQDDRRQEYDSFPHAQGR